MNKFKSLTVIISVALFVTLTACSDNQDATTSTVKNIDKTTNLPEGKTQQDIPQENTIDKPSFKDTEAYQVYRKKQLERSTGVREEVEFED